MPYDDTTLKRDGSGITPVPQHFDPTADDYEPILGRNGASRVELYGADGNPISTTGNKLAVRATEIETLLESLDDKDFATQTTLAAVLAKLSADPATQTTLAAILAKIIAAPSTEAKQDTIIGHVDGIEGALTTLNGKDFATQTTLAAILAKIIAAPATEAKQTALNALIGEVQAAPTANTMLARLKSLEDKIDKITNGTTPAVTTLSGSKATEGTGLKLIRNTSPTAANTAETILSIPAGKSVELLTGTFAMVVDNKVEVNIKVRDSVGTLRLLDVLTINGTGSASLTPAFLRNNDTSDLYELVKDAAGQYVIQLKRPLLCPNGVEVERKNTDASNANRAGVYIIYREVN